MTPFDLFVLIAFAVLIGSFLAIATIVLMIGNELRRSALLGNGRKPAGRDPAELAAELLDRANRAPDRFGGLQEDIPALAVELARAAPTPAPEAANDPRGAVSGVSPGSARAPCDFCRKLRERAKRVLRPLYG